MLPAKHRLRRSVDIRSAARGSRSGTSLLVVHATVTDPTGIAPARVGFVVSKKVGNAVVRNRTKRVLRSLLRAELAASPSRVPAGVDIVVRANPPIVQASTSDIAGALLPALRRAIGKAR